MKSHLSGTLSIQTFWRRSKALHRAPNQWPLDQMKKGELWMQRLTRKLSAFASDFVKRPAFSFHSLLGLIGLSQMLMAVFRMTSPRDPRRLLINLPAFMQPWSLIRPRAAANRRFVVFRPYFGRTPRAHLFFQANRIGPASMNLASLDCHQ